MFPTMDRFGTAFVALGAMGAAALGSPRRATGQADVWSARTVPLFGVSYAPDIGLTRGAGRPHTRYGFRALPASTRLVVTAEYAPGAERFRARADGEFRRPLAPAILSVEALASGLELIRFYGFGNTSDASQPDNVYRVGQQQFLLAPTVSVPLTPRVRLTLGPLARYTRTRPDAGALLGRTGPDTGGGGFGAYGNAELRVAVGRLSAGDVGVFGLADGGRVWVSGESSDRWHGAAGGGVWFAWHHRRANTITVAAARSPERTALYVRAGFMF